MRVSDYVILDIETTGLDYNNDEIIKLSALKTWNGEDDGRLRPIFFKPKNKLSEKVIAITGITNEDLEKGKNVESYLETLNHFVRDNIPIISFNPKFELGFLEKYKDKLPNLFTAPIIDIRDLAKEVLPNIKNYNLKYLLYKLNIEPQKEELLEIYNVYEELKKR